MSDDYQTRNDGGSVVVVLNRRVPDVVRSRISTAAFWDRFTNAEMVDYDVAMQHDPSATNAAQKAAARLRIFRREASDAGFVNLSKPRVVSFVQGLEGSVLLAGRAATILTTPITDDEAA
jgi:hypothetical protein